MLSSPKPTPVGYVAQYVFCDATPVSPFWAYSECPPYGRLKLGSHQTNSETIKVLKLNKEE